MAEEEKKTDGAPRAPEPAGPEQPPQDRSGNNLALGLCLGVLFGTVFDNLALGLCLGAAFGMIPWGKGNRGGKGNGAGAA